MPAKNILRIGGKSLLERALSSAIEIGGEIVVSTDYDQSEFELPPHALVLERPAKLATGQASMWDVLTDIGGKLHWGRDDVVILLQPTSLHPDRAGIVKTMLRDGRFPAVTCDKFPLKWHPWYAMAPDCHNYPPSSRHGLPDRFRPNGLAYLMSGCTARRGSFWPDCPKFYVVEDVLNVDTPDDWAEAVRLYG